jgi:LPXTG-site transpeptidase (sortase) family protein
MKKRISWIIKLAILALLPIALFGSGLFLNHLSTLQAQEIATQLAPSAQFDPEPKVFRGKPVRVIVPRHSIDLPVIEGSFDQKTGEWTLTNDKAQFALNSSIANNQGGNTFIYGHDRPHIFRPLADLKEGDVAEVITENNYRFVYRYRTAVTVPPTNTSIFNYTGPPVLTLQTCSGAWSQYRRLMTFDFVEVKPV